MLYSTKIYDCFGRSQRMGVGLHLTVCSQLFLCTQQFHSTHTPQNPLRYHLKHPKSRSLYSTYLFGQNLTIPYLNSHPKNHNKIPQFHTISPLPYLTTLPHSNLNKSNTNKQNTTLKPHQHNTPIKNFPNHNNQTQTLNKTLLKLRITPHTPKISTLI